MWRAGDSFTERAREFSSRRRKCDKRLLTIAILGVIQILLGLAFFTIGAWALINVLSEMRSLVGCPFWIGGLTFLSGYLAIIVRSSYKIGWMTAACILSTLSFFVTLSTAAWAFVRIVVYKKLTGDPLLFYALLISTCIMQVFVSAITGTTTLLAREELSERRESLRRLERPRLSTFGEDNFFPPPPEEWAPPPYEP